MFRFNRRRPAASRSSSIKTRRQRAVARALYLAEPLEERTLLAANLHINDVYVADRNGNELTSIAAGEVVYLQVEFSATDLPANASYTVDVTLNGQTYSPSLTWGAGLAGTSNWVLRWGTWLPTSGNNTGSATLDADGDVAETSGLDNSMSLTPFTGKTFAPGFNKPLEGTMGTDWIFVNYVDINHGDDVCNDYQGGNYCYDGHNGWDWSLANFRAMDQGFSIFAAAGGTVTEINDGEFDRQTGSNSDPANYVKIDHGGGWSTTYWHFRRNSIVVNEGQVVAANTVLGLTGSSGNSTDAHLHWGVYYQGRQVEPAVAAAINLNFAQPYPDTNPGIIDSGITDYNVAGNDFKEGPDLQNHFLAAGVQQVRYWMRLGGTNTTDDLRIEWDQPGAAGLYTTSNWADIGQIRYGIWEAAINLPALPAVGTWTVRAYINNVLEDTQTFVVGAATPEARMYFNGTYFVDGRTTPRIFPTILQGNGVQPEMSFTIANEGNATLDITSVTVPAGFTVTNGLSDIAAGGTNVLTIRLDDATAGLKSGFVTINTNDPNSGPQTFRIEGLVKSPSVAVNELLDNNADTVFLRRSGANAHIWVNKSTALTPTFIFPVADMGGFDINTLGGDDLVTVEYSDGIPYLGSFTYDGGVGTDELRMFGDDVAGEAFLLQSGSAAYGLSLINHTSVSDFWLSGRGGNDTFTIGNASGNAQIDAAMLRSTISGGDGNDTLNLNDQDDTLADAYTFAGSTFDKTGIDVLNFGTLETINLNANPANNTITFDLPATTVVYNVNAGAGDDSLVYDDLADPSGNDSYTFNGSSFTRTGADPITTTGLESFTLHANNFNNLISVDSFPGALTINGNGGSDRLQLGDGNLSAGAPGDMVFNGGADADQATLNDQSVGLAFGYNITPTTLSRAFWSGFTYGTTEHLILNANDLVNTINVDGTSAGALWTVNPGGGTDTVNLNETHLDGGVTVGVSDGLDIVNVNPDNAGNAVAIFAPADVQDIASLTIGTGGIARIAAGSNRTLVTSALTFTGPAAGTLDLRNNDMIIHATPATRDAIYADVLAKLALGINASGAFWAGNGITSSNAAADAGGLRTAIGAILNDYSEAGFPFGTVTDTFNTVPVGVNDILLKFTYAGDSDLNGMVDGGDFFLIDNAFSGTPNGGGWLNGDFDYNGILDGGDYFLIDNGYSLQGAVLAASIPQPVFATTPAIAELEDDDEDEDDLLH